MRIRSIIPVVAFTLVAVLQSSATRAQAASVVDWTSIDTASRTAMGMMEGTPVTLSWSPNGDVPFTYFQGNAPWFDSVAFTPPFMSTDGMDILARRGEQGVPSYTITFGAPVSNPVLHLGSLASTLSFVGAMPRRVSGDERFLVGGNTVSGIDYNEPNGIDANGTITFSGAYSSLTFTAAYGGTAPTGLDGITIQVGAMPGSRLVGLEVVQVIQDWRNSVPLVAGKDTVVRAHVNRRVDQPDAGLVVAELWAFDAQGQPMNPPFIRNGPGQSGETLRLPWLVNASTRENLDAAVQFYLPEAWLAAGIRTFRVQSPVGAPMLACAEQAPPVANDCSVSVDFAPRQRIRVQAIGTLFRDIQSTPEECAETNGVYYAGLCSYQTGISDQMKACRRLEAELPTHEVACLVEQNPIFLPPGNERPSSQEVIGLVIARKNALCHRCNDFYLAVTAFQSGDDYLGEGRFPIPNSDGFRTAWALAERLVPRVIGHEVGHNFGLQHPAFGDAVPGDGFKEGTCGESASEDYLYPPFNTYHYPYYHEDSSGNWPRLGPILPNDLQSLVYGFDTLERKVVGYLASSQMGYCGFLGVPGPWSDIGNYGAQFLALAPTVAVRDSTPANTSDYFWVSGSWNRATDAASFRPIEILNPPVVPEVPTTGMLELVIHDGVAPDVVQALVAAGSANEPNQHLFHAWVPRTPGITGFTVRRNGIVLATTQVSANAPQVSILGPSPGDTYIGQDLTLSWIATDTDGDPLTYRIEYSTDGGVTWEMLSSGWAESPFVVHSDLIDAAPDARFRVIAMDGFLSASAMMAGPITVIRSTIFDSGFE